MLEDYKGEIAALVSAFAWSCTSIALSSLSSRTAPAVLSALRLATGSIILFFVMLATGGLDEYDGITRWSVIGLIVSGLLGYAFGDTLYIRALDKIGIQRAFPVVQSLFIVASVAGGIFLLDEPAGWGLLGGGVLIAIGIYLVISRQQAKSNADLVVTAPPATGSIVSRFFRDSYWLLPVVGFAWAGATLLLARSRGDLDAIAAGTLRTPAGAISLLLLTGLLQRSDLARPFKNPRHIGLIMAAGIAGTAFGSLLYVYSVIEAGAARAVVLNATAPLMAVPLSILFLGERFSRRIAAGTAVSVAGVILVVS